MLTYIFTSEKFLKYFKKLEIRRVALFKEDAFFSCNRSYRPLLLAVLIEYVKFLFFKFSKVKKDTIFRSEYFINLQFKHVLAFEWGVYDFNSIPIDSVTAYYYWLIGEHHDPKTFKPESIMEYVVSDYDILSPFHKTYECRYALFSSVDSPTPFSGSKYYFRFFVFMPVNLVGFAPTNRFDDPDFFELRSESTIPPPPFQFQYPILFELFLLKFTILSFLFSTYNCNIYNYYNGCFFESLVTRFINILNITLANYFSRFIKKKSFKSYDLKLFFLNFKFYSTIAFYSFKSINFQSLHSLFYYNLLKKNVLLYNIGVFRFWPFINFSLSLVLVLIFFFVFRYVESFVDINDIYNILEYRGLVFSFFISISFFFIFFHFFYSFYFEKIKNTLYLNFPNMLFFFNKLYVVCSSILLTICEVSLVLVLNLVGLFFLFHYLSINIVFCILIIWIIAAQDKIFYILKVFFIPTKNFNFFIPSFIFFTPISLIGYLFFLLLFPLLIFFLKSLLLFFDYLKIYTPNVDLDSADTDGYLKNVLRVPFLSYRTAGFSDSHFDVYFSEKDLSFTDGEVYYFADYLQPYNGFNDSFFFKFLIDGAGNIFEIQYNYLDYSNFVRTKKGYISRTITYFPSKSVYTIMLFIFYFYFFFLNFKFILKSCILAFSNSFYKNSLFYEELFFNSYNLKGNKFVFFN